MCTDALHGHVDSSKLSDSERCEVAELNIQNGMCTGMLIPAPELEGRMNPSFER